MRVRVTFQVKNRGGLVPFHHQYLIAQVLKGLLISSDQPDFKNYSFYSFSGIKGQTRVNKRGLQYISRKVTIVISAASESFIEHLVSLILNKSELSIAGLKLIPEIAEEELSIPFERGIKYVCIAPMVLSRTEFDDEESKSFIDPASDEFSDRLYEETVKQMVEFGLDVDNIPEAQKFQLIPDEQYLLKLKSSNKKFSRIYPIYDQDVKYEIRGYTFPFTLYAAPEIQEFIFTCGLGAYCNKGFGMLDMANSDPTERTVVYKSKTELISA